MRPRLTALVVALASATIALTATTQAAVGQASGLLPSDLTPSVPVTNLPQFNLIPFLHSVSTSPS